MEKNQSKKRKKVHTAEQDSHESVPKVREYAKKCEYDMMRREIEIYMDKVQILRNMTWAGIGVFTAISSVIEKTSLIFTLLLPNMLLLATFAMVCDYWDGVRKASAYLIVFHESEPECPYRWESRQQMMFELNHTINHKEKSWAILRKKGDLWYVIGTQLAMFPVMSSGVLLIYFLKVWQLLENDCERIHYIFAGFVVIIVLFCIYKKIANSGTSLDDYLDLFLNVKEGETLTEEGMMWKYDSVNPSNSNNDLASYPRRKRRRW